MSNSFRTTADSMSSYLDKADRILPLYCEKHVEDFGKLPVSWFADNVVKLAIAMLSKKECD